MKVFFGILIFCIVLFLFIHIQFHLKTSDDLEVFEVDSCSRERLHEVCDLRQPVLFEMDTSQFIDNISITKLLAMYYAFDIKVRNTKEFDLNSELFIPFSLKSAAKLFDEDKEASYISELNSDFINESGIKKHFEKNDGILRPPLLSHAMYDILTGSTNSITPLRYDINYRNFYIVTAGSVQVKLAPPKSSRHVREDKDYDNFEFRSPINPWKPLSEHDGDVGKVKFLEITMTVGQSLYVPAYWWCSFQFGKNSSMVSLKYRTYMNTLAISPHLAMYALQRQNVKHGVVNHLEDTSDNIKCQKEDGATKLEDLPTP